MKQIAIFDTTLRDGSSPRLQHEYKGKGRDGAAARTARVDVIEAGLPPRPRGTSTPCAPLPGNADRNGRQPLPRAGKGYRQFGGSGEVRKAPAHPRVYRHIRYPYEYKLKKTREEVIEQDREMVRYAKKYCEDIEFSAEDATRAIWTFSAACLKPPSKRAQPCSTFRIRSATHAGGVRVFDRLYPRTHKGVEGVQLSVHCPKTIWAWRSPTRSPPSRRAWIRWSARSTASASAQETPRWRKSP